MWCCHVLCCVCGSCRTHGRLFYVNREAFEHFQVVKRTYHKATHRGGNVCVLDTSIIRQVTIKMLNDSEVIHRFGLIAGFDKQDLMKVFDKYITRVETMMGIEVSKQYEEMLKQSKGSVLEQLRVAKRKVSADINLVIKKTRL